MKHKALLCGSNQSFRLRKFRLLLDNRNIKLILQMNFIKAIPHLVSVQLSTPVKVQKMECIDELKYVLKEKSSSLT